MALASSKTDPTAIANVDANSNTNAGPNTNANENSDENADANSVANPNANDEEHSDEEDPKCQSTSKGGTGHDLRDVIQARTVASHKPANDVSPVPVPGSELSRSEPNADESTDTGGENNGTTSRPEPASVATNEQNIGPDGNGFRDGSGRGNGNDNDNENDNDEDEEDDDGFIVLDSATPSQALNATAGSSPQDIGFASNSIWKMPNTS